MYVKNGEEWCKKADVRQRALTPSHLAGLGKSLPTEVRETYEAAARLQSRECTGYTFYDLVSTTLLRQC